MKLLVAVLVLLQLSPPALGEPGSATRVAQRVEGRPPLAPAETLLEPDVLRAIREQPASPVGLHTIEGAVNTIVGTDQASGEIVLACALDNCQVALQAAQKLQRLIDAKRISAPARSIQVTALLEADRVNRARAVIFVHQAEGRPTQIVRGLWSTAGIGDEVVETFGRQLPIPADVRPFERLGADYEAFGIPKTAIIANLADPQPAAFIAAASAYFLATLPNAGSEALLSHLTVGAHARLAEDGRRAVSMMGNQQRAGADVLIMFGQAIEREQRRMRSFERFMPEPVDPMLRSRLADMEKGITSVWTSMGISSSPFVPAAERLRGRGGEDRRVPSKPKPGGIAPVDPPTAFLKFDSPQLIQYELANFIDGKRSISDIRDAVSAEFGALPLPSVIDYFERLAKSGALTLK